MDKLYFETEKGIISLPGKTKLTYEQNAPFFDRESLRNSFSNTFNIPGTNEVIKAFNHPQLLEGDTTTLPSVKSKLCADGIVINDGLLTTNRYTVNRNTTKTDINAIFVGELGSYSEKIEGLKLADLKIMDDEPIQGDNITNVNSMNSNNIRAEATNDYCTDTLLNFPNPYYTFPTMKVDDLHYEYVNLWDNARNKFKFINIEGPMLGVGNDVVPVGGLVPMFYYAEILKACFTEFGYVLTDDFINSVDFKRLIVVNNFCILKQRILQLKDENLGGADPVVNEQYCELDTVISAKNHMPDITIKEFLNDFMISFGASFVIENNYVTVKYLKGKTVVKNGDATPKYIREVLKPQGVTLKYDYTDEIRKTTTVLVDDYTTGVGKDYIIPLVPVFHDLNDADGQGTVFMAASKAAVNKTSIEKWEALIQSGGTPSFPITALNTFDPFNVMTEVVECPKMKGICYGLNSNYSSTLSIIMNAYAGVDDQTIVFSNKFSLFWVDQSSNRGLVETFLKYWLKIIQSTIKDIFYFNDSYLEYLENDWENFKIIGNQEYYIAKKRAQLPLRKEVEYECYKI